MADVNVNAPAKQASACTDDQILPRIRWVPIGKSNCYLDVERSQNEQWFDLTKDTLGDALQITPVDTNNAFSSLPTPDALIKFVNDMGYPKVVRHLSDVVNNDMFQPWRALTTIINLCLTRKTSRFERPRAPVLQILWGIVNRAHIDYAERIKHKFHPRPGSLLHLSNEEPILGHCKFSAKGTKGEVFGIPISNDLITDDIRGEQYYNAYLEKVAKHQRYLVGEEVSEPDSPAPKPAKATKPKASKLIFEEGVPENEPRIGDEEADLQKAVEESLKEFHSARQGLLPSMVIKEPKSRKFQPLPEVQGKGKEKVSDEQIALDLLTLQTPKKKSPADQFIFQRRTSTPTKSSGHDESSSLYAELGLTDSESESDEEVPGIVASVQDEGQAGPNHGEHDEGQAGPNPGDVAASQPPSSHVVHAGPDLKHMDLEASDTSIQPNPKQMDDEFTTTAYPNVQENLKLPTEGEVRLEEPACSAGTLSSLQNLDKELSFTDQLLMEKSQEDELKKTNTESEVQSMVIVPIHQDTSSVPLMTTPFIDLTVSQPVPTAVQAPLPTITATATATTTTTTLPPIPPQPQQGSSDLILIQCIGELEQHMADMVEAIQALEERLDKQGSRLYKLENLNILHQVSKAVDEIIIDVVGWAIQAPLRDRFRDFPEADMKEILHHRMWESNSYQAHEDHKMLYEALEKSMARDHIDQLLTDLAEERRKKKKRRDSPKTPPGSPPDQPPPPPLPAGTDALSLSKTVASAEYTDWTTTDTRLKPFVLSIPKELHMDDDTTHDEQVQSSGDEDIGHDHIPTVNLRQNWWKPLTKDRPTTPEPAWSIPSSDLPVPVNNWAFALASTYAPPPENSLLAQTRDMAIFMVWFCKKQGITELKQQDLEDPAYEIVKVFHPNVIHLQYQIEECHKLLTDPVDESIIRYNVNKPLPLGDPPGQVMIQSDFFFNKYLEYLRYGRKSDRPALSISKMKAAYYPDVGLEQMWFQRQRFYIDRHTSEGDRRAVRTYMRILSVVRIEVFSLYGYDYLKKIVLHRANLKEYTIVERNFQYLYPSNFEDLYLLNLQGHLNHLSPKDKKILTAAINLWAKNLVIRQRVEDFQLGIKSYQTQINLTKPRWDATGFKFKHDFTVINSPRAVTFRDKYGVQMIMRFNEIHKFSDDTLQQIDEALDYRVKEFKVNRMNLGLNTWFWTRKDVDRSKEFMFAIQKRLKTRRIFRNLESFVGERIRQGDYRMLKRTE
ncbi:retrovirus-related pol polyprotein from transposon TNT 1-94 [Tanacetum coccineum]